MVKLDSTSGRGSRTGSHGHRSRRRRQRERTAAPVHVALPLGSPGAQRGDGTCRDRHDPGGETRPDHVRHAHAGHGRLRVRRRAAHRSHDRGHADRVLQRVVRHGRARTARPRVRRGAGAAEAAGPRGNPPGDLRGPATPPGTRTSWARATRVTASCSRSGCLRPPRSYGARRIARASTSSLACPTGAAPGTVCCACSPTRTGSASRWPSA